MSSGIQTKLDQSNLLLGLIRDYTNNTDSGINNVILGTNTKLAAILFNIQAELMPNVLETAISTGATAAATAAIATSTAAIAASSVDTAVSTSATAVSAAAIAASSTEIALATTAFDIKLGSLLTISDEIRVRVNSFTSVLSNISLYTRRSNELYEAPSLVILELMKTELDLCEAHLLALTKTIDAVSDPERLRVQVI